jgi:hypothetical protein
MYYGKFMLRNGIPTKLTDAKHNLGKIKVEGTDAVSTLFPRWKPCAAGSRRLSRQAITAVEVNY